MARGVPAPKKTSFETRPCSRCGGCGQYSFNLMHGTTCYGCGGSGLQYTARGLRQRNYYEDAFTVPFSALEVGSLIWGPLLTTSVWWKVTEIDQDAKTGMALSVKGDCWWPLDGSVSTTFRIRPADEETRLRVLAEALKVK